METMNSKDKIFEGKAELGSLLETAVGLDEAEQVAFLMLGDVYRRGKYAGYERGKREAAMAAASEGGEA